MSEDEPIDIFDDRVIAVAQLTARIEAINSETRAEAFETTEQLLRDVRRHFFPTSIERIEDLLDSEDDKTLLRPWKSKVILKILSKDGEPNEAEDGDLGEKTRDLWKQRIPNLASKPNSRYWEVAFQEQSGGITIREALHLREAQGQKEHGKRSDYLDDFLIVPLDDKRRDLTTHSFSKEDTLVHRWISPEIVERFLIFEDPNKDRSNLAPEDFKKHGERFEELSKGCLSRCVSRETADEWLTAFKEGITFLEADFLHAVSKLEESEQENRLDKFVIYQINDHRRMFVRREDLWRLGLQEPELGIFATRRNP